MKVPSPAVTAGRYPLLMGVVNLTPDSFSDGGDYNDVGAAFDRIETLIADGADIIDLGAESTRPGASQVPAEEEWKRLEPLLKRLSQSSLRVSISVDTRKPSLMLQAADYGATWFNDIGGHADITDLATLASYPEMHYIAMHMPITPDIMQVQPMPAAQALANIKEFFAQRMALLAAAGFGGERVWFDPGIGFGKTDTANLRIMQEISLWSQTMQMMIGVSRKSLIGRILDISDPKARDAPSKMLEFGLALCGAKLIRTHNVAPLKRLFDLVRGESDG